MLKHLAYYPLLEFLDFVRYLSSILISKHSLVFIHNFWSAFLYKQVSIPLGMHENLPISISLLAKHGSDGFLLNVVESVYATLKQQFETN